MLFKTNITLALSLTFVVGIANWSLAQSTSNSSRLQLKVEALTDSKVFEKATKDTREVPDDGIPDGRIAKTEDSKDIVEAWYTLPTSRYRHGALGDDIEGGALKIRLKSGRTITKRLPSTEVFEDLTPRIADLNGDGRMEVVTIRASRSKGASITVYSMLGSAFIQRATTGFIGTSNRWLNIAGIGKFTGSKYREIAFVDRPHLRGELKYLQLDRRNQLLLITRKRKFSNHVFGSTEQRLSSIVDLDRNGIDELVIPHFDRKTLSIFELTRNGLNETARATLPSPIDKAIGTRTNGGKTELLVGLEDGSFHTISR